MPRNAIVGVVLDDHDQNNRVVLEFMRNHNVPWDSTSTNDVFGKFVIDDFRENHAGRHPLLPLVVWYDPQQRKYIYETNPDRDRLLQMLGDLYRATVL